jgi:hypothetical protein
MRPDDRINPVLSALHAAAGIYACARKQGDERGTVSNYVYAVLNLEWNTTCHSNSKVFINIPCADSDRWLVDTSSSDKHT